MKIKQKGKIQKPCTNCFAPQYLKFNFSYIVYEEDFEKQYQLTFLKRLLSSDVFTSTKSNLFILSINNLFFLILRDYMQMKMFYILCNSIVLY